MFLVLGHRNRFGSGHTRMECTILIVRNVVTEMSCGVSFVVGTAFGVLRTDGMTKMSGESVDMPAGELFIHCIRRLPWSTAIVNGCMFRSCCIILCGLRFYSIVCFIQ